MQQQPAAQDGDALDAGLQQEVGDAEPQAEPPGRLVAPGPGARAHFCVACDAPIAVYGHLIPCMHTYCLACATDMPVCLICKKAIHMIRRLARPQPVFISPVTLQGFGSEELMARHTARLYQHIMVHQATALQSVKAQLQAAAPQQQQQQPQQQQQVKQEQHPQQPHR